DRGDLALTGGLGGGDFDDREQLLQGDHQFERGQRAAGADVLAGPVDEVVRCVGGGVELIGGGEGALVAVGGGPVDQEPLALSDLLAGQSDRAGRHTAIGDERRVDAQQLV